MNCKYMTPVSLTSIWQTLGWKMYSQAADVCVTGVKTDSRHIKKGDLFIANAQDKAKRIEYMSQAQSLGAVAVAVDAAYLTDDLSVITIPVWGVPRLLEHEIRLAQQILHNPSEKLSLVGITGTNGKTSVANYLAQSLSRIHHTCAIIGTTGYGLVNGLRPLANTTPDGVTINSILAQYVQNGIGICAMEVSSHGLHLNRVQGCHFDVAVFTNLTTDHLDFHNTMEAYGEAKCKLFQMPGLRHAVVNIDDPLTDKIITLLNSKVRTWTYSLSDSNAIIHAAQVTYHAKGIQANIMTPVGSLTLDSALYGAFNLSNLLATIGCLLSLNISLSQVQDIINDTQAVVGRMEGVQQPNAPMVMVDYAHTPSALDAALCAIRTHFPTANIICVFGCGGDRDVSKRPLMAEVSEKLADSIIITDDNPRFESSEKIINDILQGIKDKSKVKVIADRAKAIQAGIEMAHANDVVLIAGKGHETFQIIANESKPFSDRQQVESVLQGVTI